MTEYYVKDKGKIFGPVERSKLISAYEEGFFTSYAIVSTNQTDWEVIVAVIQAEQYNSNSENQEKPNKNSAGVRQPHALKITPHSLVSEPKQETKTNKNDGVAAAVLLTLLLILLLIAGTVGGYWYFLRKDGKSIDFSGKMLQARCVANKKAIGVVTVTLENVDGKALSEITPLKIDSEYPVGTAFAISPNEFVTTAGVLHRIKTLLSKSSDDVCFYFINMAASNAGARSRDAFRKFSRENSSHISLLQNEFAGRMKIKNVCIRNYNGELIPIRNAKIHPKYSPASKEPASQESDIAILNCDRKVESCLELADKVSVSKSGRETAVSFINQNGEIRTGKIIAPYETENHKNLNKNSKILLHNIPISDSNAGAPIFLANGSVIAIQCGISTDKYGCALRIDAVNAVKYASAKSLF